MRVSLQDVEELVKQSSASGVMGSWLDDIYAKNVTVASHVTTRMNCYRFLYHLVALRQPVVVLELGVEFGLASAYMCKAAKLYGGCVVGVDHIGHGIPRDELPAICDYIYIVDDTLAAFPLVEEVVRKCGKIGVVFQDSSHHYDHSCKEWELYNQLLDENAVWVCDDITPAFRLPEEPKGMVEYFQERPGQKAIYPDVLHYGNTVGVIVL